MNKTLIYVVIGVLVLALIGYVVYANNSQTSVATPPAETMQDEVMENEATDSDMMVEEEEMMEGSAEGDAMMEEESMMEETTY